VVFDPHGDYGADAANRNGTGREKKSGSQQTRRWRGQSTANSSLKNPGPVPKLGADFGRVMDDSGTVKRHFALEFRQKLCLFPLAAGSALPASSARYYARFRRWALSAPVNLPSIKSCVRQVQQIGHGEWALG
jgi:hypothetical protein